jgi:hypothetical protein
MDSFDTYRIEVAAKLGKVHRQNLKEGGDRKPSAASQEHRVAQTTMSAIGRKRTFAHVVFGG